MALRDKLLAARDRAKAENDHFGRADILNAWGNSVATLSRNIAEWVRPYEDDGLISTEIVPFLIKEEPFGEYTFSIIQLRAGNHKIVLQPIARFVSGSTGRVDMYLEGRGGADERYRLLRKSQDGEEERWGIIKPLQNMNTLDKLAGVGVSSFTVLGPQSFEEALNVLLG